MPTSYQLTPRALNDLNGILNFIAEDSADAANRVELAIFSACESLARHPRLGSKRVEITSRPLRFWPVTRFSNFIIVYLPETKPLQVVAVLHAKRNIKALLEEPFTL
jgi:plasmid stabilization system protein ParE